MGGCITLQELSKKWKALRDRYLGLKGKKQPSGSGATADHTWKYYKQMNFVDLAAETQETTSSIPLDPTTPTSIPQSILSSKKRSNNEENDDRFFKAIENINKSNLDEVDHFALRLSSGLRRLLSKLEINFLQQLHDAEFNSF
ncbi:unnamed protein product [Phaedon cochleariae]|uniref:MADF domain-containing protein n=1 Tax=Phaedon cochleariae TaxID=80249 RepID=A0A9N9S9Z3_PHACE|nr:unnamed protein product [Phaedon cochleariae]